MDLAALIREVPDFPRPGIVFKDITPLLGHAWALADSVRRLASAFGTARPDKVLGIEARGFILAAPVAVELRAGFVPARKKGKLPWETVGADYELEYGAERIEMHSDAVRPGDRVLIVDDVLATGGTAAAAAGCLRHLEAEVVGLSVLIELEALKGRSKLAGLQVRSVLAC